MYLVTLSYYYIHLHVYLSSPLFLQMFTSLLVHSSWQALSLAGKTRRPLSAVARGGHQAPAPASRCCQLQLLGRNGDFSLK